MSCYNQQYTGMPDYGTRIGSMGMPGWQNWQGSMGGGMNAGNLGGDMGTRSDWMDRYTDMGNPPASIQPQCAIQPQCEPQPQGGMQPQGGTQPQGEFCPDSGRYPLAMSYVPMQRWTQPLPVEKAITRGTIFKELDLPFMMGGCR